MSDEYEVLDFLEHYGVKGMKWGVRNSRQGGGGSTSGVYRNSHRTQSRAARNGKRVAAAMIGGPIGLVAYNAVSRPLNAAGKAQMRGKTQSRTAQVGKTAVATLLVSPIGGYAYYQMGKKVRPKKTKSGPPKTLTPKASDTKVTKAVKADYNKLSDKDFRLKYAASKKRYAKRVEKHGDPYRRVKKSPLVSKSAIRRTELTYR